MDHARAGGMRPREREANGGPSRAHKMPRSKASTLTSPSQGLAWAVHIGRVGWRGDGKHANDARQHDSVTTPLHGGSAPGHGFAGGFTFLFFLRIGKRIVKKFRPLRNANHEAQTLTTARPPHPTTARGAGCPFIRLVRMYADRVKRRLRTVCSIHLSGESIWSLPFHTSLSI